MNVRSIAPATVLVTLALAAPAQAARECEAPAGDWQRATPAEAGMDAARLQAAMDYGTSQASFAVRVFRNGCLVAEDRGAAANRLQQYESWSLAKSVTSLVFGRAMTLGLISPDDVVGSVVPEADGRHGDIRVRDLLTMTSGLRWNGLRDYNIFTMRDRLRDALTLEVVRERGTYYEYAQSAVALLAEAVGRAAGEDFGAFAQRELMDPLGIPADAWYWKRDGENRVLGFMGVNMRPDDFGRLGELLRRGGVWRGRRLLSEEYAARAVTPSQTNGCYGWLIWVNAGRPCIGPTIQERPVSPLRDFPALPPDLFRFSGLFGQLVTVLPTQGIVVVRTGQDPGLVNFSGGTSWEAELYTRVLASVVDERVERPGPDTPAQPDRNDNDYGFQTAIREPDEYRQGAVPDPLPAAGPQRARASRIGLASGRVSRTGRITLTVACPPRPADRACDGVATLERTRGPRRYSVAAGTTGLVRFTLTAADLRAVRRTRGATLRATATNADAAAGVPTETTVRVAGPLAVKRRAAARRGAKRGGATGRSAARRG